jgi:dihydroxyacid dehydratase/phosphogluconate dehydratase
MPHRCGWRTAGCPPPLDASLTHADAPDGKIIRPASDPLERDGCFAFLKGNLASDGAVVKKPVRYTGASR